MNEGCDGGWSILHSFLTETGYLVSEECAPYEGVTKGKKCSMYEKCKPIATTQNSYMIGGGYG